MRAETTAEGLAKLKPAFREGGTVTAGNASLLSDGAAAVVVAGAAAARKLESKPLARVIAYATSGIAPKDIFLAPVAAVRQVLDKAGLTLTDIDLFEMNEAFAAQMLACAKELQLDEARVNVHGGRHRSGPSHRRFRYTRPGHSAACPGPAQPQTRPGVPVPGGGNAVAMIVERV